MQTTKRCAFTAGVLVLALSLGVPLGSCRRAEKPVASVSVEPSRVELAYPQEVPLEITWEPRAKLEGLEGEPLVFVHLLGPDGDILRTFDHPLRGEWHRGETLSDRVDLFQSALAPPLAAGSYRLTLGLYDRAGHRWPLAIEGEEVGRREYVAATVEVPTPVAGVPHFSFSTSWQPVEPGGDRQVLARRWLAGEGTIEATGFPSPGTVTLVLVIPDRAEPGTQVVVDDDSGSPTVLVSCSCGTAECAVSGPGRHEISIPVEPRDHPCVLRLEPNFHVLQIGSLGRRSVAIERLSWRPRAKGDNEADEAQAPEGSSKETTPDS